MKILEIKKVVKWSNVRFGYYGKTLTIITMFWHERLLNGATTQYSKHTLNVLKV